MNLKVSRLFMLSLVSFLFFIVAAPASAITPTEVAKLLANNGAARDYFGNSVALDGDTVLIGAWGDQDNGDDSGSAYVFTRSGSSWTEQAKLTAIEGAALDLFGNSVALFGDTALIGAWGDHDNGNNDSGSAYVFTRSGSSWTELAKLTASDGAADDWFGISVALDGDTAVVGAEQGRQGVFPISGAAYVFTRSGGSWTEQAKLLASDGTFGDGFGRSVALSGDTLVIGALERWDGGGYPDLNGSAYIFTGSGSSWREQAKLTASDGVEGDNFGISVALGGDTAVIGAFGDDDGGNQSGSAYVFSLGLDFSTTFCSTLGDNISAYSFVRDTDKFSFTGLAGETISLSLDTDSEGTNNGGDSATLILRDQILGVSLLEKDTGPLVNNISVTLPSNGPYNILVKEQRPSTATFEGDYCLSLESDTPPAPAIEPISGSVE